MMEKTKGIMHSLQNGCILSAWEEVLKLQTEIFGNQELQWLNDYNALENEVLEIGSAMGHYGDFLAKRNPNQYFYGLEASEEFLANTDLSSNYHIDRCLVGVDPIPLESRNRFKTCLLRYVLQHSADPLHLLSSLFEITPIGGKVFIIEEDDSFFTSNAHYLPFETAVAVWRKVCQHGKTDSRIGLKLPSIIQKTGFTIEDYKIRIFNSLQMGNAFFEFCFKVALMMCKIAPDLIAEDEIDIITEGFSKKPPAGYVATYAQIMIVAKK